jgi:hypothetical protein
MPCGYCSVLGRPCICKRPEPTWEPLKPPMCNCTAADTRGEGGERVPHPHRRHPVCESAVQRTTTGHLIFGRDRGSGWV